MYIFKFFCLFSELDFGNFVFVLVEVFFLLIECDFVKFFKCMRLVIVFLLELFMDICDFFLCNEFSIMLWMMEELGDFGKFL